MVFRTVLILSFMASQATAGAWPREKGHGFLSFSTEFAPEDDSFFTAAYAEYGITNRITAGVDLGLNDDDLYKAVAFGGMPLSDPTADWKLAVEIGIGVIGDEAVLRPGLSFGRGISIGERSGWLSIENLAIYEMERNSVDLSTDITLGLNWTDTLKFLVQLQSGQLPMDPAQVKLAPSVLFEASPGFHLELGAKTGLADDEAYAIKLGLWCHF